MYKYWFEYGGRKKSRLGQGSRGKDQKSQLHFCRDKTLIKQIYMKSYKWSHTPHLKWSFPSLPQFLLSLYPRFAILNVPFFPPNFKIIYHVHVSFFFFFFIVVLYHEPYTSGSAGVIHLLFKKIKVVKVHSLKHPSITKHSPLPQPPFSWRC